MDVCVPQCASGGQKAICRCKVSPSTMWDLELNSGCQTWLFPIEPSLRPRSENILNIRLDDTDHCWFRRVLLNRLVEKQCYKHREIHTLAHRLIFHCGFSQ